MSNSSEADQDRSLSSLAAVIVELAFGLLCFFSLASFIAKWWWRLELFCHWRFHYTLLLLPCLGYLGYKRKLLPLVLGFAFVIWGLFDMVPLYCSPTFVRPAESASQPNVHSEGRIEGVHTKNGVRLLLLNVDSNLFLKERDHRSLDFEPFMRLVDKYSPDILALNEFFADWAKGIESLRQKYPFGQFDSSSKLVGPAIWSRLPLSKCEPIKFGRVSVHTMVGVFQLDEKMVTLMVTHPLPPIKQELFAARNAQLEAMVKRRDEFGPSLIVCGDFNCTTFSPYLKEFHESMGLFDGRQGFGLQATWPTFFPPLAIAIDHFFLSPDLKVKKYKVGPCLSSDHYPVIIDLEKRWD